MPSHHSSSSHSSSSRSSSSHSSSSRSSSSRSSSSRSSYSSGSRSSYSSGSSGSRSYRSSGPSAHSSTSHSSMPSFGGGSSSAWRQQSRPVSRPVSPPARPAPMPKRPRVNQPVGFLISQTLRPTYYYGRRHDYVYYPESWTDTASGTYYEKGYYDENGKYYDSVAFQKNGRYENVVCYCPYCESKTMMNLNNSAGTTQSMTCPNCGGPMEILSELDEIAGQPADNTHVYNSEESLRNAFGQNRRRRGLSLPLLIILAAAFIVGRTVMNAVRPAYQPTPYAPYQQIDLFDGPQTETLYLARQADGSFRVVTDDDQADITLAYDADEDSYYDADSDCWLWYNTEVDPPVWQYWVEGISSDFGEYGWMEHDEEGWWIEASEGDWIPLPAGYDTDGLWYID